MKNYICIDIGGTAIKYGVITDNEQFLVQDIMDTEAYKGGPVILEKVISIVEKYQKTYTPSGICISTAGMVDVENGIITYANSAIPDYTGIQFKKVLEERFSLPCSVENDVNCAGLAESISGAAKDNSIALCLTIGTGIGGCIVINKEVFRGYTNSAGEVGYMHMFDSDFQSLGAASVLCQKVSLQKGNPDVVWDGHQIFDAAKDGDEVCCRAIEEMTDILGRGIANICYVLNPQVVVLGGGIMSQGAYLYSKIRAAIDRYLLPHIAEKTTLKMAVYQNRAGMLGAYYHFKKTV